MIDLPSILSQTLSLAIPIFGILLPVMIIFVVFYFDNKSKIIGYILGQNGDLINSDYTFENDVIYDLKINNDVNEKIFILPRMF